MLEIAVESIVTENSCLSWTLGTDHDSSWSGEKTKKFGFLLVMKSMKLKMFFRTLLEVWFPVCVGGVGGRREEEAVFRLHG